METLRRCPPIMAAAVGVRVHSRARDSHSILQGFQRVGSNFLPLGTPISNAADYWRAPAGGSCPDALASVWRKLPACGIAAKIPAMKFLDPDTESAVRDFLARIPGDIRLDRAILFGSRARGEHRPDSDADVALILHERGDDGETLMMLAELAYYAYLDTGIMVQPVPIAIEDWLNPAAFPRPGFLRNVAREGIVL